MKSVLRDCLLNESYEIYIPREIFGYIVSCISTQNLLKYGTAFTCKLYYEEIFGNKGLLTRGSSRVESDSNKVLKEIIEIKKEYGQVYAGCCSMYAEHYSNSFPDVVGKLFFGKPLTERVNESRMFMQAYLKDVLVDLFKKALDEIDGGDNLLKQENVISLFKFLDRKNEPVIAKLNFISFWIDSWHNLDDEENYSSEIKQYMLKAFNLIFFANSKVVQKGCYDGRFPALCLWVKDEDFLMNARLESLKIEAWKCFKSCYTSKYDEIRMEVAIAAGLLCLSKENISAELKEDALLILNLLAKDEDPQVVKQVATTIILLNKHTSGGFENLLEADKSKFRDIFNCFVKVKDKKIAAKVKQINQFIGNDLPKSPMKRARKVFEEKTELVIDNKDNWDEGLDELLLKKSKTEKK